MLSASTGRHGRGTINLPHGSRAAAIGEGFFDEGRFRCGGLSCDAADEEFFVVASFNETLFVVAKFTRTQVSTSRGFPDSEAVVVNS